MKPIKEDEDPEVSLDLEFTIPKYSSVCSKCQHFKCFRKCEAFTEIPLDIWTGENTHNEPVDGDKGIIFEEFKPQ